MRCRALFRAPEPRVGRRHFRNRVAGAEPLAEQPERLVRHAGHRREDQRRFDCVGPDVHDVSLDSRAVYRTKRASERERRRLARGAGRVKLLHIEGNLGQLGNERSVPPNKGGNAMLAALNGPAIRGIVSREAATVNDPQHSVGGRSALD